jgi:hypothetical protein
MARSRRSGDQHPGVKRSRSIADSSGVRDAEGRRDQKKMGVTPMANRVFKKAVPAKCGKRRNHRDCSSSSSKANHWKKRRRNHCKKSDSCGPRRPHRPKRPC